jgi:Flp pilus assembly protein CpaB
MTDDFVAERRRRRFVLIGGLVLGLVAAVAVYFLLTRTPGGTPAPTLAQKTIVVAAVAIPARTTITQDMIKTDVVPDDPAWSGTATDPKKVVGQAALVNIPIGAPIQNTMLSGSTSGLQILGPDETVGPDSPIWRAVSITVPADRAVGGQIGTGDHVDLIVTMAPQLYDPTGGLVGVNDPGHPALFGQVYSDSTTKVTMTDIQVLQAVTDSQVYILKVDEHQAEEIAHIQSSLDNQFTLTLRPQADTRSFDPTGYGQTNNSLFNLYAFPIPVQINVAASASPGLPTPLPSVLPSGSPVAGSPSPSPSSTP